MRLIKNSLGVLFGVLLIGAWVLVYAQGTWWMTGDIIEEHISGTGEYGGTGEERIVEESEVIVTVETDPELWEAIAWMHSHAMTKYTDVDAFRPHDYVSRQEAAKFFGGFAIHSLFRVVDQTMYCYFDDIESADPSLKNSIIESCMLHIFHGSGGQFFPHRSLTKAEALAVLMRSLEWTLDESGKYRRANYLTRARELWLTKEFIVADLDRKVTRYEIALLLKRAGEINSKM